MEPRIEFIYLKNGINTEARIEEFTVIINMNTVLWKLGLKREPVDCSVSNDYILLFY